MTNEPPPLSPFWAARLFPRALASAKRHVDDALGYFAPIPDGYEPQQIREWIIAACDQYGISATKLGTEAGLSHSTLTRFLRDKDPNKSLTGKTLNAIVSVLQSKIKANSNILDLDLQLLNVPVCGKIQSKVYLAEPEIKQQDILKVRMPIPYAVEGIFGFEVMDDSAKMFCEAKTIVFAIPLIYQNYALPEEGSIVVLHRRVSDKVETTLRETRYETRGSGAYLMSLGGETSREVTFIPARSSSLDPSDLVGFQVIAKLDFLPGIDLGSGRDLITRSKKK